MGSLFVTVRTAAGIWAGTSIEDFVLLAALFLASRATGRPRPWQIVAGWYVGIAFLVAVSAVAALGLIAVPQQWTGLLGLAPLSIGAYKLIGTIRSRGRQARVVTVMADSVLSLAAIPIASGGDNFAVYVPVFRSVGPAQSAIMIMVFAVCLAVWCLAAWALGSHKKVIDFTELYGHWVVPCVYMVVGALVIADSGIVGHLTQG
jgi:cadmium resistance protein CadD (predicted permease)